MISVISQTKILKEDQIFEEVIFQKEGDSQQEGNQRKQLECKMREN